MYDSSIMAGPTEKIRDILLLATDVVLYLKC